MNNKYRLNDGLVDLLFQTNSSILKNHLIFSYAFSEFCDKYETGRGRVYVANTRLKRSSIFGLITGIIYWFLHKGVCQFDIQQLYIKLIDKI